MHPTQIQVTDTVTPARDTGAPATAATSGTDESVRDVLLAAAKYLSEHGWNQHEYYADPNTVNPAACTVGALSMVCYGYPAEDPSGNVTHPCWHTFGTAVQQLNTYADDTFGGEVGGVYGFNDTPGRTVGEVLAMLRIAASPVPAPRCGCNEEPMAVNPDVPFSAYGNGIDYPLSVCRVYVCRTCRYWDFVEVADPADRIAVQALYQAWARQLPHEGDPHVAGTSEDCDTCVVHCFCSSELTCVLHSHSDDESPWSSTWHVPGDPQFGTAAGAALGGAE